MNNQSDQELLRTYAEHRLEPAFAELVRRHLNFVFSAALRLTRNRQLAEDVSQGVFTALARQSQSLAWRPVLSGWLHCTTRNLAAKAVRTEVRRQAREQEAAAMKDNSAESEPAWEQLATHLDSALGTLSENDRNAIILRFIYGQSLNEVGISLGTTEAAAKKRVSRAIEKLRTHFARQGMAVSASVLTVAIAANAVHAAPAGLASSLVAGSLAAASHAGTSGLTSTLFHWLLAKAHHKMAWPIGFAMVGVSVMTVLYWPERVNEESLRKGLVLHYRFDQEVAGGQANDTSGLGNHGRVSGTRWIADGKQAGAFEFTAAGDRIEVPNHASLNPKLFTLAAWIKSTTQDGVFRRIFDKFDSDGFALSIAGDRKDTSWRGLICLDTSNGFTLSQNVVTDGQWHHIVAAYDGTKQWLYVDGQRQPDSGYFQKRRPELSNNASLIIGGSRPGPNGVGAAFAGVIDEPMMFNRILTPKEVAFLFAQPKRQ